MDKLPCFLIKMLKVYPSTVTISVIMKYLALIHKYDTSDLKYVLLSTINLSIVSR